MLDHEGREAVQIICSECGEGAYRRDVITTKVCCGHCGHHIYEGDIELEDGETLTWLADRTLGYTPALDCADMFGHHSEDRVSVYRGRGLQTMCGRHASELGASRATHCAACGIPLTPQNRLRQHAGGVTCSHGPHD